MNPLYKYIEWITWVVPPPYIPKLFEYVHFLLFILYIPIFRFYIKRRLIQNGGDFEVYRFAVYTWYFRILGGVFVYYFYLFYYGGGDVVNYVKDSIGFFTFSTLHFSTFIRYLIYSISNQNFCDYFFYNPEFYFYWSELRLRISYMFDFHSEMVAVLYLPFIFLGLGGYLPSLVVFNAIYAVYLAKFIRNYLRFNGLNISGYYYLICNLPSFLIWTGAPLKESFALLFMIYAAQNLFGEVFSLYRLLVSLLAIYLTYIVKPYLGVPFLVVFIIAYLMKNKTLFSKDIFYSMIYSLIFTVFFFISGYFSLRLAEKTGKYSPDRVLDQAYLIYMDLQYNETYYTQTGGSVYDLGPLEPTLSSFLSKFPLATFTALFRPFLTEGRKSMIFLASLEATTLLILFIYLSVRHNVFKILRYIYKEKASFYFFISSIFILSFIGLTSGNFGNLVRYRVPPYFFFWIIFFTAVQKVAYETDRRRGWQ